MFENHKAQMKSYCENNKVSLKERKAISYFFNYIRSQMQNGDLNNIRLKYFGVFKLNPGSLKKYGERINKSGASKEIKEEIISKINSHLNPKNDY